MSVVRFEKIIFYLCVAEQSAHTYWKVFSKVLLRKCGNFQQIKDSRTALILGIFYCDRAYCVLMSHIYTECGALERLLDLRSPQPS